MPGFPPTESPTDAECSGEHSLPGTLGSLIAWAGAAAAVRRRQWFRTRTCVRCGCYLRMLNPWELCDPCTDARARNGVRTLPRRRTPRSFRAGARAFAAADLKDQYRTSCAS